MKIDHEIISTVILLSSSESLKKGCCQLQVKVCARSLPRKKCGNNNNNNNNNSLYFQRVTHLAKRKKLIFHEALYELPPKNNTSKKYKDDLHVYNMIQTSWNPFKPTYTQAWLGELTVPPWPYIAVNLGRKATKQTKQKWSLDIFTNSFSKLLYIQENLLVIST